LENTCNYDAVVLTYLSLNKLFRKILPFISPIVQINCKRTCWL